jgi:hypothetical protein
MIVFPKVYTKVKVTPVVDIAGAYAANDAIAPPFALDGATTGVGQPAGIAKIIVKDNAHQNAALRFFFFDTLPSTVAANAAFAPSDADMDGYIGHIDVAAGVALAGVSVQVNVPNPPFPFKNKVGKSIYCVVTTTGTPTYVGADDLSFTFLFEKQ